MEGLGVEIDFGWGTLVEMGPRTIIDDESLFDLVALHARLARDFIAGGAAFVIGRIYVEDIGFVPELDLELQRLAATPTDLDSTGLPGEQELPKGTFVPRGTSDLAARLDLPYAIGNNSLFILKGLRADIVLDADLGGHGPMRGAVYTQEGRRNLCDLCEEFIYFGSDGEYLRSLSTRNGVRDWLPRYQEDASIIGF